MRRNDYYAKGGKVSGSHVKKELAFMKDKGAPADMIKAEKKEHGFNGGGSGAPAKSRYVGHGKFNFAEGGVTEGENKNIDDATRARAMEFVRQRMAAEAAGAQPAVRVPPIRRRPAPPAASDEDERVRAVANRNVNFSNEGRDRPAPPAPTQGTARAAERPPIADEEVAAMQEAAAVRRAQAKAAVLAKARAAIAANTPRPLMPEAPSNEVPGMLRGGKVILHARGGKVILHGRGGKIKPW